MEPESEMNDLRKIDRQRLGALVDWLDTEQVEPPGLESGGRSVPAPARENPPSPISPAHDDAG